MLSLKDTTRRNGGLARKTVIDLPSEVLDDVFYHIFVESAYSADSIVPASLTCRHFRHSTNAIMFRKLTILLDHMGLRTRSMNVLQYLAPRPHLMKHVRFLDLRSPIQADSRHESDLHAVMGASKECLREALCNMSGLCRIALDQISYFTIYVLECVVRNMNLEVFFNLAQLTEDHCTRDLQVECASLAAQCSWRVSLGFPPPWFQVSCAALAEFAKFRKNHTVAVHYSGLPLRDSSREELGLSTAPLDIPNSLELSFAYSALTNPLSLHRTVQVMGDLFRGLRKLQLEGQTIVDVLRQDVLTRLSSLIQLRLHPFNARVFHPGCTGRIGVPQTIDSRRLAFSKLISLEHLELYHVCHHITLAEITAPKLRSLVVRMPEYISRRDDIESVRSPAEIRWLVQNVPQLERLEIHVGDLDNLWNPTAVSKVDVDPNVYQFLQALTGFRHLKTLRLFPFYLPRDERHGDLDARQPLSDEQAVRIFRYLKSQRPSLQMLSIGATFERLLDFASMSWCVKAHGNKLMLTTRQAGKDYEVEQVWVGERRMTTRNKRHTYRHPYLPDLGDWTFTGRYGIPMIPHTHQN